MVEISKHLFEQTCADLQCRDIVHPWHKGCFQANIFAYKQSLIGSCKFYSLIYMLQILMRGKKMLKKEEWIKMGEYYARSSLLGLAVCGSAVTMGCIFSRMQGNRMAYYTYILIPSILNGLAIYLEPPSRRGLVINLFCNLLIEYWLNTMQRAGYLTVGLPKQTLMFMVGSALLFYLMRLEGEKKERTPLFWLFTPENVKTKTEDKSQNVCPHEGPCEKHVLKGFSKLFGAGLALTLARVVLPKIGTPLRALSAIKAKHFKMALFFGSYIGIYRAVVCFLCRKRGGDSPLYALPAGYLAGLSFVLNPNLGFSIASLTAAFKLYSTILYEKKMLPDQIPLPEILYCFCQGTLFHARVMHPDVCPKYMFKLMDDVSHGSMEILVESLGEAIQRRAR